MVHPRRQIKTCCHTLCPLQAKSDIYCLQMTKKTISRSPSSIQNFILLFYLISRRRHFFAFIIYHVIASSFRSRSLNNNLNMRSSLVESKCTGNELKCKQLIYKTDLQILIDNTWKIIYKVQKMVEIKHKMLNELYNSLDLGKNLHYLKELLLNFYLKT